MFNRVTRRLAFVVLMSGLLSCPARAGQETLEVVTGAITPANYPGFVTFLADRQDMVVGLKISFLAASEGSTGGISASLDEGQFVVFAEDGEYEIVTSEGVTLVQDHYQVDGFFRVTSGGIHQGVMSLVLEKVSDTDVAKLKAKTSDLAVDDLPAE